MVYDAKFDFCILRSKRIKIRDRVLCGRGGNVVQPVLGYLALAEGGSAAWSPETWLDVSMI